MKTFSTYLKHLALGTVCFSTSLVANETMTMEALLKEMKDLKTEVMELRKKVKDSDKKITTMESKQKSISEIKSVPANMKSSSSVSENSVAIATVPTSTWPTSIETDMKNRATANTTAPHGYISIPGTNTSFKFGGWIKVDAIYDAGVPSGDSSNIIFLPLNGFDAASSKRNCFRINPKGSRFNFATASGTAIGDVGSFIEVDFLNNNYFTGTNLNRIGPAGTNSATPRLRQAYVNISRGKHTWLVGQTWTTYWDGDAYGTSLEFNNLTSTNGGRQPMFRYSYHHNQLRAHIALENPLTDYTDQTGVMRDDGTSITGDGFQSLPDLVTQIKWVEDQKWHLAFRGVLRQLRIKRENGLFTSSKTAYGIGLSGRSFYQGKSAVFAQVDMGTGIGRYIYDLVGSSAAYNSSARLFRPQFATSLNAGVEHYWTEKWRSNIAYGISKVHLAKFVSPSNTFPITRKMEQFMLNVIYSPIKELDVGVEYDRYRRFARGASFFNTINSVLTPVASNPREYSGVAHRFQFTVWYKF